MRHIESSIQNVGRIRLIYKQSKEKARCSGQPKLDSKLGFPSATAGGNPPFAVCGLRQL
jgi:hypothetical protein